MNRRTIRTGVVGCGAISDIYLTNMIQRFDNLEVVACCAKHLERAQAKAQKYGIRLKNLYKMNRKQSDYVPEVGDRLRLR